MTIATICVDDERHLRAARDSHDGAKADPHRDFTAERGLFATVRRMAAGFRVRWM
jgi:hypothetical protein